MEQLLALLKRMDECGVGRMRLNGGEPLVRKDLLSFTEEMSHRGIRLYELLTNGTLLTENLLDSLEAQGHKPVWFVSFDGLSCHDWLRGVHCSVGCRVGALAQGNGLDGIDERICVFYESGCYM